MVKVTTNYAPLLSGVDKAFDAAVQDVVEEAQRRAPKRTGKFAASITSQRVTSPSGEMAAVVGSPFVSARVKEKGGFMQAKGGRLLVHLANGTIRTPASVRVKAQPAVTPAGAKWPELLTKRLQEAAK